MKGESFQELSPFFISISHLLKSAIKFAYLAIFVLLQPENSRRH